MSPFTYSPPAQKKSCISPPCLQTFNLLFSRHLATLLCRESQTILSTTYTILASGGVMYFSLFVYKKICGKACSQYPNKCNMSLFLPPIYNFLKYSLTLLSICIYSMVSPIASSIYVLGPAESVERSYRSG